MADLSIVIPAKNEADSLRRLLPTVRQLFPNSEIIVVDDGSTDDTVAVCDEAGVTTVSHRYSMGNGAAIKSGTRLATGSIVVFMDADGQHDPADIPALLTKIEEGYDMAIGARQLNSHASIARRIANTFYNRLASLMTGHKIADLTSGFRAVRARHFRRFLYLLPNGFSYPTTCTMAFFRSGLAVSYVPITAGRRDGVSNIKLLKDGTRFFIIILKVGSLFSPMRLFFPISFMLFSTGVSYYLYTYLTMGRFTNMSMLLFISALFTFLIGILSEQVSSLHYRGVEEEQRRAKRNEEN